MRHRSDSPITEADGRPLVGHRPDPGRPCPARRVADQQWRRITRRAGPLPVSIARDQLRRSCRAGNAQARPSQRDPPVASTTILAAISARPPSRRRSRSSPSFRSPVTAQAGAPRPPNHEPGRAATHRNRRARPASPYQGPLASDPNASNRRGPPHSIQIPGVTRADDRRPAPARRPVAAAGARPRDEASRQAGRAGRPLARRGPRAAPAAHRRWPWREPAGPPPTTTTSASTGRAPMGHFRAGSAPCCPRHRPGPARAFRRAPCACPSDPAVSLPHR